MPAATSRTWWPAADAGGLDERGAERGDHVGGDGVVVAERPHGAVLGLQSGCRVVWSCRAHGTSPAVRDGAVLPSGRPAF